jgi:hypothetical protein
MPITIQRYVIFVGSEQEYERWKARPALESLAGHKDGHDGRDSCFSIIPSGAVDQPAVSGWVANRPADLCQDIGSTSTLERNV